MKTKNQNSIVTPSSAGMSLERFAVLAEAYGGDIDRWPEPERFSALSLAGRSEEARTLLADADRLDFLLSRFDAPTDPSSALRERIASLETQSGRTARPGFDVSGSIDPVGASAASTRRSGLFSAVRSNALMLSVVVNLVLAGTVGGMWIASPSSSGPPPVMANGFVEFEEALSEELGDDFVFADESDGPSPVDDVEIALWPDADQPSDDDISAI